MRRVIEDEVDLILALAPMVQPDTLVESERVQGGRGEDLQQDTHLDRVDERC